MNGQTKRSYKIFLYYLPMNKNPKSEKKIIVLNKIIPQYHLNIIS